MSDIRRPEPEPRQLLFCAEYGAESPIWDGGYIVCLDTLPLSDGLQRQLFEWTQDFMMISDDDEDRLETAGKALFQRTQDELGDRFVLTWEW